MACVDFLCPGTPEDSTGSGSGFKSSQKTVPWLKVSSDRLGEVRNRTCDPWFTRHIYVYSLKYIYIYIYKQSPGNFLITLYQLAQFKAASYNIFFDIS